MGESFDIEEVFDEDYLYFSSERLNDATTDREFELLWEVGGLQPGHAVLDLACGHGRMANRLATKGAHVVGLDATLLFLEHARVDAAAVGVDVEYVHGDMRDIPWRDRFDVVVSWFTAFGYFDDDDNRRVLAEAHAALRPGGRLVLDLNHRDELMRRHLPTTVTERDGNLMLDRHVFDPLTGRNTVERTLIRDGTVRRATYFTRMFTFTELRGWLQDVGFPQVDAFGEDAQPLTIASKRMITVAQR